MKLHYGWGRLDWGFFFARKGRFTFIIISLFWWCVVRGAWYIVSRYLINTIALDLFCYSVCVGLASAPFTDLFKPCRSLSPLARRSQPLASPLLCLVLKFIIHMLRTPDPDTFRERAALLRAKAQSLRARDPGSAWKQKGSAAKVDVEEGRRHEDSRGLLTSLLCETIEGGEGGEEGPEGDPEACFAVRDALAQECSVAWRGLDLTQPGGTWAAAEGVASLLDVLSDCAVSPDGRTEGGREGGTDRTLHSCN